MHFYTYKITNLINGKIYIGVHKTTDLEDGYMGSGVVLKRAFEKYGSSNFSKEILMVHDSSEEMFEIEALIVDEDFLKRKDVYNIKLGGKGGWDYTNSSMSSEKRFSISGLGGQGCSNKRKNDEDFDSSYRLNMSKALTDSWNSGKYDGKMEHLKTIWLGRNHKPETIEKVKETFAKIEHQQGEKNSQYGKMWIHSLEERRSTRINKNEPIPNGWSKGRKMFKD